MAWHKFAFLGHALLKLEFLNAFRSLFRRFFGLQHVLEEAIALIIGIGQTRFIFVRDRFSLLRADYVPLG
jgi:hypothetical protein